MKYYSVIFHWVSGFGNREQVLYLASRDIIYLINVTFSLQICPNQTVCFLILLEFSEPFLSFLSQTLHLILSESEEFFDIKLT